MLRFSFAIAVATLFVLALLAGLAGAHDEGAYVWRAWDETKDYCLPIGGGMCHGAYDHSTETYRRWYGGNHWSAPTAAPIAPRFRDISDWRARQPTGPPSGVLRGPDGQLKRDAPGHVPPAAKPKAPTGVIESYISATERYTYKGQPIAREQALALVCGRIGAADPSKLIDDTQKDRLTVQSADKVKRAAFLKAFAADPAYASLRARCSPWEADPADWSLDVGYAKGEGVVILQKATGEVLARAQVADVTDGAQVVGEVRKANPGYDQAKDPTPAKPAGGGGSIDLQTQGPTIATAAALGLAGFFSLRRKPS